MAADIDTHWDNGCLLCLILKVQQQGLPVLYSHRKSVERGIAWHEGGYSQWLPERSWPTAQTRLASPKHSESCMMFRSRRIAGQWTTRYWEGHRVDTILVFVFIRGWGKWVSQIYLGLRLFHFCFKGLGSDILIFQSRKFLVSVLERRGPCLVLPHLMEHSPVALWMWSILRSNPAPLSRAWDACWGALSGDWDETWKTGRTGTWERSPSLGLVMYNHRAK